MGDTVAVNVTKVPYADGSELEVRYIDVGALLKVINVTQVLDVRLESPSYSISIRCSPAEKTFVENVAKPPDTIAEPIFDPYPFNPSQKITFSPLGTAGENCIENVSTWPYVGKQGLHMKYPAIGRALLIVCNIALLVLVVKLGSPEYAAVME